MPYEPTLGPHDPPAIICWALAGVANAVAAKRAAKARDESFRIHASVNVFITRVAAHHEGMVSPGPRPGSPLKTCPLRTSRFPSSDRPTRPPSSSAGRGDLPLLGEDRGLLAAIEPPQFHDTARLPFCAPNVNTRT